MSSEPHPSINLRTFDNSDFDRGAPAWKESLWRMVQGFFFQPLWFMPSPIRVFWLRSFGAHIGKRMVVRAGVNIHFPWKLTAGDDVWLGEECMILNLAPVTLGDNVCISQRAFLCTGSHDFNSGSFDLITEPIQVQSGSWIAAAAFVGPGVTIGQGSLVAAGTVLVKNLPPAHKALGNPAQIQTITR